MSNSQRMRLLRVAGLAVMAAVLLAWLGGAAIFVRHILVDLDVALVAVIGQTVQPAQLNIWFKRTSNDD